MTAPMRYTRRYPVASTIRILISGWLRLNRLAVHWLLVQYTNTPNAIDIAANPHTILTGWIIL